MEHTLREEILTRGQYQNNTQLRNMKLKTGLRLRKIGSHHMVVRASADNVDMTDVYTLNDSAAMLWQRAQGLDVTAEMLASWLMEEYDVDRKTALTDAESLMAQWQSQGLAE